MDILNLFIVLQVTERKPKIQQTIYQNVVLNLASWFLIEIDFHKTYVINLFKESKERTYQFSKQLFPKRGVNFSFHQEIMTAKVEPML